MGINLLNVGISGLDTAQGGLQSASHNIANASTPGYNRQRALQRAITPQFTGAGFLGKGSQIVTVERLYNRFLSEQVKTSQTRASELETYATELKLIDNMLSDPEVGMSPAVRGLVEGINAVTGNPSSIPARQSLLANISAIATRFNDIDERVSEIRQGVGSQLANEVSSINTIADQISGINDRISAAESAGDRLPANDLRDQRDALVIELNKHVKAEVLEQSDGSFSVFVGSGQALVLAGASYRVTIAAASNDRDRLEIGLQAPNGIAVNISETLLSGGALGGFLTFRREALEPAQGALGRMAMAIAAAGNTQHRLGQDLTGAMGGDMFTMPVPVVSPNTKNDVAVTAPGTVAVAVTDFSALTTSDYVLTNTASGFSLVRSADNVVVFANSTLPRTVEGLTIRVSGAPALGSSFKILPTRYAARDITSAISDPRAVAAGVPVLASAAIGNTGTGVIGQGALISPLELTFDGNAVGYTGFPPGTAVSVFDGTTTTNTNVTAYSQAVALPAGSNVTVNGITFRVTGKPANGDVLYVGPNVLTPALVTNTGTVALGPGGSITPTTLTFADANTAPVPANPSGLRGFAVGSSVTVKNALTGVSTSYKIDLSTETVPYTTGDTFSYNGLTFTLTDGATAFVDNDTFIVGAGMLTGTGAGNAGSGVAVALPLPSNSNLGNFTTAPITLTAGVADLTGFAAGGSVTVTTTVAGVTTTAVTSIVTGAELVPYTAPGTATIVYTPNIVTAAASGSFGFTLTGTPTAGDTFTFGLPPTTGTNTGDGTITQAATPFSASLPTTPYSLTYDKINNRLTGFPAGTTVGVTVAGVTTMTKITTPTTGVTYTSGMSIAVNGVKLELSGAPNHGDSFSVAPTPAGTADNRNALLLAALQTAKGLIGGTATFEQAYAQLVSFVGNKAREVNIAEKAQSTQLTLATSAEQSFSGVNLDEEAGNLLRFQQAYQAAAKVIQIATKIFDELLNLGR